jgi:hypothetical protein
VVLSSAGAAVVLEESVLFAVVVVSAEVDSVVVSSIVVSVAEDSVVVSAVVSVTVALVSVTAFFLQPTNAKDIANTNTNVITKTAKNFFDLSIYFTSHSF